MENILLIVHLILALALIVVVLLQRSEGGGLGMGSGGGGGGGIMTGRQAANALTRLTWIFAAAFICTSIAMTILSAQNSGGGSVLDRLGIEPSAAPQAPAGAPVAPEGNLLPPPATGAPASDAPAAPPRAD